MNLPKIKPPPPHEWIILAAILGTLGYVTSLIIRESSGPRGEPIPSRPPDEANRVRHPAGFSIVAPPDWGFSITAGLEPFADALFLAPLEPGPHARRSKALLRVTRIGQDGLAGLDKLRPTTFQGREAFEREMSIVRADTFDDPPWSESSLYVSLGEDWFRIDYGLAEERTTTPSMVRRYLETLRPDRR